MYFDLAQYKQKGQILIWIIVGALIVVVTGGVYLIRQNNKNSLGDVTFNTSMIPPSQTPQTTSTSSLSDETANWKTYVNNTYGYSIKIPLNYNIPPQTEKEKSQIGIDKGICAYEGERCIVGVNVFDNLDRLSLNNWMNKNPQLYNINLTEKIKLNDYEARLLKKDNSFKYFLKNGDFIFEIGGLDNNTNRLVANSFRILAYKKRQFDPNKTIAGTKFYQDKVLTVLQSINDLDLVGMNCTPTYYYEDNNFSYFNKDSNTTQVTDPQTVSKLSNSVQRAQNTVPGKTVSAITICDTEDNRAIVIYETALDQFGSSGGIYFGLDNENSINILANIKNRMYESCVTPLQLTKNNQLFYECVQAETLGGAYLFYKINFTNSKTEIFAECPFTNPGPNEFTIKCN